MPTHIYAYMQMHARKIEVAFELYGELLCFGFIVTLLFTLKKSVEKDTCARCDA